MPAAGTDTKSLINAWRKTNEQELSNSLKIEYGFSPALARSLVQLMHEHVEANYGNLRGDSQVIYHAISAKEGPGKSIDNLKIVPVTLTVSHPDDAAVLKEQGVPGLRKHKLLRFANEAYDQGGLLIQEDLALLLTTSIRTIQRDMQEMRRQGIVVPTRGEIQDIGPTVSHKTQIIELYLKGYEYTEIEQRTRHTGDSIKRYISGFSKVVLLSNKGYSIIQIRELTNSSEKVVSEYLALYKTYKELASDRLNQTVTKSIEKLDSKKGGLGSDNESISSISRKGNSWCNQKPFGRAVRICWWRSSPRYAHRRFDSDLSAVLERPVASGSRADSMVCCAHG